MPIIVIIIIIIIYTVYMVKCNFIYVIYTNKMKIKLIFRIILDTLLLHFFLTASSKTSQKSITEIFFYVFKRVLLKIEL